MKNFLDKFQEAWQSQCNKPLDVNPGRLLKVARLERQVALLGDMVVILILGMVGIWMLSQALPDLHREWPWLIYTASDVWVIGFMVFNQWRRRRHAARFDEPLLAHVEWSIRDIDYRARQDRNTFWWYTLPIALGCMVPPTISFGLDYIRKPKLESIVRLLSTLGFFVIIFLFIHLVITMGIRMGSKARRQELEALRALRETLLTTEEPHV